MYIYDVCRNQIWLAGDVFLYLLTFRGLDTKTTEREPEVQLQDSISDSQQNGAQRNTTVEAGDAALDSIRSVETIKYAEEVLREPERFKGVKPAKEDCAAKLTEKAENEVIISA